MWHVLDEPFSDKSFNFLGILNQRRDNKWKKKNTTLSQQFENIIEKLYKHFHDPWLSWLGTDISIKSGRVKLLCAQSAHTSKIQILQVSVFHM